jgi:hypothetical protein
MLTLRTTLLVASLLVSSSHALSRTQTCDCPNNCGTNPPSLRSHLLSNNAIDVRQGLDLGGSVTSVFHKARNVELINNLDAGRQIQSAVWGHYDQTPGHGINKCGDSWNPNQAGNGPHGKAVDSFYAGTEYLYTRSVPDLWFFDGCTCDSDPVDGMTFKTWIELIENYPAFMIRTEMINDTAPVTHMVGQHLIPAFFANALPVTGPLFPNPTPPVPKLLNRLIRYAGSDPWATPTLAPTTTFSIAPWPDGQPKKEYFRMTECWDAITDEDSWGLAMMSSTSGVGMTTSDFAYPDGPTGVFGYPVRSNVHTEIFSVRVDDANGSNAHARRREGRAIYYVGPVVDARNFFAGLRPTPAGEFIETFDSSFLKDWDANSSPTYINPAGHLRLDQNVPTHHADVALRDRVFGEADFEAHFTGHTVIDPLGPTGWWGVAVHKVGNQSAIGSHNGYYLAKFQGDFTNPDWHLKIHRASDDGEVDSALATVVVPGFDPKQPHSIKFSITMSGTQVAFSNVKVTYKRTNGTPDETTPISCTDTEGKYRVGYCSLVAFQCGIDCVSFSVTNSSGDGTPPNPVTNLMTSIEGYDPMQLRLSWTNPSDWLWTRVVKKQGSDPQHQRDGELVYEGKASTCVDVDHAFGDHYSVFTVDRASNWSSKVSVPFSSWLASTSFTPTSCTAPFCYRYEAIATPGTFSDMAWKPNSQRWEKDGTNCMVKLGQQHPHTQYNSCRVWEAPSAGIVRVTASVGLTVQPNAGDGVYCTIVKETSPSNTTTVWGPQLVSGSTVVPHDVGVLMNAGDKLYFRVNLNTTLNYDTVTWDPQVEFMPLQ